MYSVFELIFVRSIPLVFVIIYFLRDRRKSKEKEVRQFEERIRRLEEQQKQTYIVPKEGK